MPEARAPLSRLRLLPLRLVQFTAVQLACCAFPIAVFLGMAASVLVWNRVDMPLARYDALLIYVLVVQLAFVALRLETWRELAVICAFHLIGLALEVFKVRVGSWTYPEAGVVRLGGVPIFSGFMYASVGGDRYRMPTAVSFLLIGVFLWLAENLGTFLNAWRYPDQQAGWHLVHVGKLGSWALLVTLSFVLVAAVKAEEGVLYGDGEARVSAPPRTRRTR
ncbi:Protein of unknown function [Actinomyces ruminicola]|uniref:DUF817 domain-containing protein n=1 Tax=Actinomyces ruminicola TaxID=332524 RepID=A0A1H0CT85_9ACTO|nr:DUF817 family protein [Actinomyces ruminicola]SDN60881.1 Protein of unknown function [Actinomyces ruminicola]